MAFDTDLTLLYQFAKTKSLNSVNGLGPNLTITRTGAIGTYVDSDGVIQIELANTPRFTHTAAGVSLGLLFEGEPKTNFFTHSNDLSHANYAWTRVTSAVSTETAPDGTTDAVQMVESTDNNTHYFQHSGTIACTLNNRYTISMYVHPGTRDWVAIEATGASAPPNAIAFFNVTTGVVGTKGSGVEWAWIEDAGNGFYRVMMTFKADSTSTARGRFYIAEADNDTSFTGTLNAVSLHVWGGQFEKGNFPTSFIFTTTVAVTRTPDASSSSDTTWFSNPGCTHFVVCRDFERFASMDIWSVRDEAEDTSPSFSIYHTGGVANFRWHGVSGFVGQVQWATYDNAGGALNRIVGASANSDHQGYLNGTASNHITTGIISGAFDHFSLGRCIITGQLFSGVLDEIRFYKVRKIDQFLEDMSNGLILEGPDNKPNVIHIGA